MTNQLVATNHIIYVPKFDHNKGIYYDESPYKPYERNCQVYECRCKAGGSFRGNLSFKSHIKSQTHKDFITNYSKYYKEVDEAMANIKELRVDLEKIKRENERLKRERNKMAKEILELRQLADINEEEINKYIESNKQKSVILKTITKQIGVLNQIN